MIHRFLPARSAPTEARRRAAAPTGRTSLQVSRAGADTTSSAGTPTTRSEVRDDADVFGLTSPIGNCLYTLATPVLTGPPAGADEGNS